MVTKQSDLHAPSAVLTTHVLNMGTGRPGEGMRIELLRVEGASARKLDEVTTNADGRCDGPVLTTESVEVGTYRLDFHVGEYLGLQNGYLDIVPIEFSIADAAGHYHVPLLLAPWGYSTYRGAPPARAPRDNGRWNVETGEERTGRQEEAAAPSGSGPAGMTTHVIDIARGCGAGGLAVDVLRLDAEGAVQQSLRRCLTTAEGRTSEWLVPAGELESRDYELVFHLGDYFANAGFGVGPSPFFSLARVRFRVSDPKSHHHIPLLATPWGYTTYRGS